MKQILYNQGKWHTYIYFPYPLWLFLGLKDGWIQDDGWVLGKKHFGLENNQSPNPGILIVAQISNDMVLETSPWISRVS